MALHTTDGFDLQCRMVHCARKGSPLAVLDGLRYPGCQPMDWSSSNLKRIFCSNDSGNPDSVDFNPTGRKIRCFDHWTLAGDTAPGAMVDSAARRTADESSETRMGAVFFDAFDIDCRIILDALVGDPPSATVHRGAAQQ